MLPLTPKQQQTVLSRTSQLLPTILGLGGWARQPKRSSPPLGQDSVSSSTHPSLPPELWNKVFIWLYPSELQGPIAVNTTWRDLVQRHQVWTWICNKAKLGVRPKFLPQTVEWQPDHFALVQASAHEPCESCDRPKEDRTLPVTSIVNSVASRIQMCRDCQVSYYENNPEPIPKRLEPFCWEGQMITAKIDSYTAVDVYSLPSSVIETLPFGAHYVRTPELLLEADVLTHARQVFGGDVGYAAAHARYLHRRWNPDGDHRTSWDTLDLDDEAAKRQILLRSLWYDEGLCTPPHKPISQAFVTSDLGNPQEIVKELRPSQWLRDFTNYDRNLPEDQLYTVKFRPQHGPAAQETVEGTLTQAEADGEVVDWRKMIALDAWLTRQLERELYQSYKVDPDSPAKPPRSKWPLLDRIDMSDRVLDFAFGMMISKWDLIKVEVNAHGLEHPEMWTAQVKGMIDEYMRTEWPWQGDSSTLTSLLEEELGSEWCHLLVQKLAKSLGHS
ncbi:hypothetical protein BGX33_009971 [Mortierella sp. NVP41]|nr:hypothetical protein BGX33_009971 [Mortierella sp. NVP41]